MIMKFWSLTNLNLNETEWMNEMVGVTEEAIYVFIIPK